MVGGFNGMSQCSTQHGGIGLLGGLGLMFVGLKLTGYIDWSWWWVTLPFWGVFALVAVTLLVLLALAVVTDKKD